MGAINLEAPGLTQYGPEQLDFSALPPRALPQHALAKTVFGYTPTCHPPAQVLEPYLLRAGRRNDDRAHAISRKGGRGYWAAVAWPHWCTLSALHAQVAALTGDASALAALAREMGALAGCKAPRVRTALCDVTRPQDCEAAISWSPSDCGVDLLIAKRLSPTAASLPTPRWTCCAA